MSEVLEQVHVSVYPCCRGMLSWMRAPEGLDEAAATQTGAAGRVRMPLWAMFDSYTAPLHAHGPSRLACRPAIQLHALLIIILSTGLEHP